MKCDESQRQKRTGSEQSAACYHTINALSATIGFESPAFRCDCHNYFNHQTVHRSNVAILLMTDCRFIIIDSVALGYTCNLPLPVSERRQTFAVEKKEKLNQLNFNYMPLIGHCIIRIDLLLLLLRCLLETGYSSPTWPQSNCYANVDHFVLLLI